MSAAEISLLAGSRRHRFIKDDQVGYKAYPGDTCADLAVMSRSRSWSMEQ